MTTHESYTMCHGVPVHDADYGAKGEGRQICFLCCLDRNAKKGRDAPSRNYPNSLCCKPSCFDSRCNSSLRVFLDRKSVKFSGHHRQKVSDHRSLLFSSPAASERVISKKTKANKLSTTKVVRQIQ